jgi:release factor glutamine methyltransferase
VPENLLDAVDLGTRLLSESGIEQPRLDAELLLSHLLRVDRVDLYLNHDKPLTRSELSDYLSILRRRAERTPVQYLTKHVDFFSNRFLVEEGVFIPRRDTEVLVEQVVSRLEDRVNLTVLEIGTGCGNIAVSLATSLRSAEIYATDISPKALSLARRNAERLGVDERVRFLEGDLFDPVVTLGKHFDLIVSNPPYIREKEAEDLPPEVRAEPLSTYIGGEDGLKFIRKIVDEGKKYLLQVGVIALEIGCDQGEAVGRLLQNSGYEGISLVRDLAGNERVVIASRGSRKW